MYCPKCSQEQVSDETRFCSRCGFQLNVVKALLADDSATQNLETQKLDRSLRKRDLTVGAGLMFFFAFIVAVFTVSMPANHSSRILLLIVAWLLLSLSINTKPMIQYFTRGEQDAADENYLPSAKTTGLFSKNDRKSLPTTQSIPADLMMPSVHTADFAQPPPSVTEPTTNLLKK